MEDVSINLEDAVGSGEDLMPASSSNRKQQQQYDYGSEEEDPMQLAHAAMMGQEDNVDQEIEQIINKQQFNGAAEDEYDNEDARNEEGYQDDDGEDDSPINPELIAAAQEMGLDLNSEQMRELQQFLVKQKQGGD